MRGALYLYEEGTRDGPKASGIGTGVGEGMTSPPFVDTLSAMASTPGKSLHGVLKVPLVLTPQPEGGFTVTSPILPELITEGDTVNEAIENVRDALAAVVELYEDEGRKLPSNLLQDPSAAPIWFEGVIPQP